MKTKELLNAYKLQLSTTPNVDLIFSQSAMVKDFKELEFGFFPVGSGVLTSKSKYEEAEILECETMVLGNDFGTIKYVNNQCKNNRESNSKTIDNLEKIGLTIDKTFFTNFYIGLRDEENHPGTTMTKLIVARKFEYKSFCFEFFKKQLAFMNPKTILCLGTHIGQTISEISPIFSNFSTKKNTLSKLFSNKTEVNYIVNTDDNIFGKRKFILIPHPSYAHINWKKHNIKQQIENALN